MEIILYSVIAFLVSLTIQMVFIIILHTRKKANKTIDAEEEYKLNMRLVIRIIIAIIISVIISIITFYVLGIAVIGFLRQGH